MEVVNITKAATFKTHNCIFCDSAFYIFFMRRKLTDDFLGLHENMIYAFPLK